MESQGKVDKKQSGSSSSSIPIPFAWGYKKETLSTRFSILGIKLPPANFTAGDNFIIKEEPGGVKDGDNFIIKEEPGGVKDGDVTKTEQLNWNWKIGWLPILGYEEERHSREVITRGPKRERPAVELSLMDFISERLQNLIKSRPGGN